MLRVAEQYSGTDTGRQRRANEDALLARSPLFVVADGMGGAQAGEVASNLAVESFRIGLEAGDEPELSLTNRIAEANARIYELSRTNAEQAGMGTTLTALYVGAEQVSLAHVGDSRAYCMRDGQLIRLTHDHSLVDELIRQGKLTPAEAQDHPQRWVITRALGPEPSLEVDTLSYPARDRDVYLICSDGLTTMVSDEQVAAILDRNAGLHDAGEALLTAANEAGGRDNITVILFRVETVGPTGVAAELAHADGAPDSVAVAHSDGETSDTEADGDAEATLIIRPQNGVATAAAGGGPSMLGGPSPGSALQPVSPLRPRQPTGQPGRRRRRWRPGGGFLVAILVIGIMLGGAALAIQSVYFIGTNNRGFVTVFTGLPYQLPDGLHLYTAFYVSGVPAAAVPPLTRHQLLDNAWRSQTKVTQLIHDLELGQLAGQ